MSDMQDISASYCSDCGEEIESAQKIVGEESFLAAAQGVAENDGVHIVVDGSEIRIYVHGDGENA